MAAFKDNKGREWLMSVDVYYADEIEKLYKVDILSLYGKNRTAADIANDPRLLVNIAYVLCRDQCERQNVTDIEFGKALVGDAIQDAYSAMLEAVADFFPYHQRQISKLALAKSMAAVEEWQCQTYKALKDMPPLSSRDVTDSLAQSESQYTATQDVA